MFGIVHTLRLIAFYSIINMQMVKERMGLYKRIKKMNALIHAS